MGITILPVNDAPVITSAAVASAVRNNYFLYLATATDAEDSTLVWTFDQRPGWLASTADSIFGTPLAADADTTFRVIAFDGDLSDTLIVAITVTSAPLAPSGLIVQALDKAIRLSWQPGGETDLSHYLIYRGSAASFDTTGTQIASIGADTTRFTDEPLINGQTYFYKMVVVNQGAYVSPLSAEISATPESFDAGWAISFDGVDDYINIDTGTDFFGGRTTLTISAWVMPVIETSDFTQMTIVAPTTQNPQFILFDNYLYTSWGLPGSEVVLISETHKLLMNQWRHVAATYDGQIARLFVDGEEIASITMPGPFPAADGPLPFSIGAWGNGLGIFNGVIDEVRIWSVVRTAEELTANMHDYLSGDEPGLIGYWRFDEGAGTVASATLASPMNGDLMNAPTWVTSTAPIRLGDARDIVSPAMPVGLQAEAGDGSVQLTWRANSEADFARYVIYGGTAPGSSTPVDTSSSLQDTTILMAGLTNDTTYYYRITAIDQSGNESPYSTEMSATPADMTSPPIPLGLVAVADNQSINLSWRPVEADDFAMYVVYGGETTIPTVAIDTAHNISDSTLVFTSLTNGTTYFYRLTSVDSSGNESDYSDEVSAAPVLLALDELAGIPKTYALHQNYPNPFNPVTLIRFDLPEATDLELVIYDLRGRSVVSLSKGWISAGYHRIIWDGRDKTGLGVPSGVYIARLVTPIYTKSIKMVLLK
ncbi:MAG: T9SS type A sorting domain-containing protein [Proteobacteria bacterium]|nr:T9SS type A sorting domain-containing protein [Pseudomonadota bacterium]